MNILKSIFLILLLMSSQLTLSQLRIEITGGAEDPINVAVVPIDWRLEFPAGDIGDWSLPGSFSVRGAESRTAGTDSAMNS